MAGEVSVYFQLSVWHPVSIHRRLGYEGTAVESAEFESQRICEEIYFWQLSQIDPFGSIVSDPIAKALQELISMFAPGLPPVDRSMRSFAETVRSLRGAFQDKEGFVWADLTQTAALQSSEPVNLRGNTGLALVNHLSWVASTFEHLPRASVTIR